LNHAVFMYFKVWSNRVMRRIFGSRKDEVTGEWRKLHNEEMNDLYLLTYLLTYLLHGAESFLRN
jgi:hypothetical protein